MVSDLVLTRDLPEFVRRSAEAYAGCISGAERKYQYLAMIEAAGFANVSLDLIVAGSADGILQLQDLAINTDVIVIATPEIAGMPYVIAGLVAAGGLAAGVPRRAPGWRSPADRRARRGRAPARPVHPGSGWPAAGSARSPADRSRPGAEAAARSPCRRPAH